MKFPIGKVTQLGIGHKSNHRRSHEYISCFSLLRLLLRFLLRLYTLDDSWISKHTHTPCAPPADIRNQNMILLWSQTSSISFIAHHQPSNELHFNFDCTRVCDAWALCIQNEHTQFSWQRAKEHDWNTRFCRSQPCAVHYTIVYSEHGARAIEICGFLMLSDIRWISTIVNLFKICQNRTLCNYATIHRLTLTKRL